MKKRTSLIVFIAIVAILFKGFSKWTFAKNRHFIDLISIGIVAEDGRTYSAISNEYSYKDANDWVKENVILPMYIDSVHGDMRNYCSAKNFHKLAGKANNQIAKEIIEFINPVGEKEGVIGYIKKHNIDCNYPRTDSHGWAMPEFYGYYSDYDWVLFCSLFGTMMDLPKGFPMYCIDLKQQLDEKCHKIKIKSDNASILAGYPSQQNEHNALSDAKWNYELYKFIQTL